ncbi:MAG: PAS domain S-box protein [Desulfobacterales bacterium]|nr:PAS domain S-box protein [Desulfobacterales bacterium]
MTPNRQDEDKTKGEPLNELAMLRQHIAELETSEIERKRAEEALQETRDYLDKLLNYANAPIIVWDAQFRITRFNHASEHLTGYTSDEVTGQELGMLFPQASRDESLSKIAHTLKGKRREGVEIPILRKDGDTRLALWNSANIYAADDSTVLATIAQGTDITERKQAEEALKDSERELSQIVEGSSVPTFVINKEHIITYWNKACENLTGVSASEVIGTKRQWSPFYFEERPVMADIIVDNMPEEEIARHYDGKYGESALIEGAYEAEDFFPQFGESGKWLFFTAAPLRDREGKVFGAIETLQDITEQKRLRENLQFYIAEITKAQEEERKRIARDLHDDAGQSLLLLTHQLDAIASDPKIKLANSVQEKLNQVHSLAVETLGGLRRYAQELRPSILDDLGLVAALEWMADKLITEDGIDADVQLDMLKHDLPHEAQLALFRIAQEAVGNIERHAEASKVVIRLESGGGKIRMIITDNGKGFEAPMRLSDLSSTGKLGLLGMQERARLLRGTLSIESELGKGTTVIVEISPKELTL